MTPDHDHPPRWLAELVRASEIARSGGGSAFYRAVRAGQFVKVAHSVYLPATVWNALTQDERYLARVHGVARSTGREHVFSHESAAALWRLPAIDPWPPRVHVVVDAATGGRSRVAFTAHAEGIPGSVASIHGLSVTDLSRTVIDVGRSLALDSAVVMADRALALTRADYAGRPVAHVTPDQLRAELSALAPGRGTAKCALVLDLADGMSGSAGESLSRVGMHVLGLPSPVLQQQFRDADGLIGVVDFWWPHLGLVGEFDGRGKYLRDEFLHGRSTADSLIAEKTREDRLRAVGCGVTRWGWEVARSLPRLREHLRRAGLR